MRCNEIKIGALYPLTGDYQLIGQSIYEALEFYVDLVNNQDQLSTPSQLELPDLKGAKVKLIWADTKGDPLIAQAEAIRLIEEEGVTSIIGSYQSTVTSVAALQTESHKIPYVSPDTNAKSLTNRGFKWFFRTCPYDVIFTKKFFDMLVKMDFSSYTIGLLAENSLLGQDSTAAAINLSRLYGDDIVAARLYAPNLPITKQEILDIKSYHPDFLFTAQFQDAAIRTMRILQEMNYYPMALFSQTTIYANENFLRAIGKDADYIISAAGWTKGLTKFIPLAKKVNYMFKARYGHDLGNENTLSFTGLYVLIDAIARAGSDNPGAIRKALIDTDIPKERLIVPWHGVSFDKSGQNILADSLLVQIFNETAKIVWPEAFAEAKVVLPAPPWCKR